MHPISRTSYQGMGHGMMTSSNGNIFRVTGHLCGEFTGDKGQWGGALVFPLICARINSWVSNREASDLSRHRAQYDVIVMDTGRIMHYSNVIWALWRFTSSITQPILLQIVLASNKRNIKASHYPPFARGNHARVPSGWPSQRASVRKASWRHCMTANIEISLYMYTFDKDLWG